MWSDGIAKHFIEHVGQCSNEEDLVITPLAIEAIPVLLLICKANHILYSMHLRVFGLILYAPSESMLFLYMGSVHVFHLLTHGTQ